MRSANCLQNANIRFIGELVQRTEAEMLKTKNFGRKSLNEIKETSELGLELGMTIDNLPSRQELEKMRESSAGLIHATPQGRKQAQPDRAHRKALFRNMVTSLLEHERIETTDAKAKELRGIADRMITLGKRGHARTRAARRCAVIRSKDVTAKVSSTSWPSATRTAPAATRA